MAGLEGGFSIPGFVEGWASREAGSPVYQVEQPLSDPANGVGVG